MSPVSDRNWGTDTLETVHAMSLIRTKFAVEYPDSDGDPMGESDWHIDWTIRLRDLLKWRYRDRQVYVGSDLIIYYQEGEPLRSIVPDGFVVLGHSPHLRRIFKTWDEDNRVPDVAFEFTSLSSKIKDTVQKPEIYASIGVTEYFIYDCEREYLNPPLQGFRLDGDHYEAIERDADSAFQCQTLGLKLRIEGDKLAIYDSVTGKQLLTEAEAEAERAEAEAGRAEAEAGLRKRVEAENDQLRAELRRLRGES